MKPLFRTLIRFAYRNELMVSEESSGSVIWSKGKTLNHTGHNAIFTGETSSIRQTGMVPKSIMMNYSSRPVFKPLQALLSCHISPEILLLQN